MTEIKLWNNFVRDKVSLEPTVVPRKVSMYVCGPTVYDRAHIGNARPVVVFDVLYRLLRHVYGERHVTYVRNITDVDDKINARAAESGRSIREITEETIRWYHEDMRALGALKPTHEPRATQYIPQMVAMIETLIVRGHAYVVQGHVLFSVASYPGYGKLARRSLDEMRAGARVEIAPYKRDPMDFVLWKPSTPDLPGWPGPKVDGKEVSFGRPGWHLECSAMSEALLGTSFDIHGGGSDLMFPHHENEIAQSMCAHPEGSFARIWMHNGFLNVEGEKMSKSLGNFVTVNELLRSRFDEARVYGPSELGGRRNPPGIRLDGKVIRTALLLADYKKTLDWGPEIINEAHGILLKCKAALAISERSLHFNPDVHQELLYHLRNDLDTRSGLKFIGELSSLVMKQEEPSGTLAAAMEFMGILEPDSKYVSTLLGSISRIANVVDELLRRGMSPLRLLEEYDANDRYRDKLRYAASRILDGELHDTLPKGFVGTQKDLDEISKVPGIPYVLTQIHLRDDAKRNKDYGQADAIRNELLKEGVALTDVPGGVEWRREPK